ncbi:MAG: hypothetical protein ACK5IQ_06335 [Bacteroidales bacterium]
MKPIISRYLPDSNEAESSEETPPESTSEINVTATEGSQEMRLKSHYCTYPLTTYELKLQDFVDAGLAERTELIEENQEGNEVLNPQNKEYVSAHRDGIALHSGRATNSAGCITLDLKYHDTATQMTLFNNIFSGNDGEYENMSGRDFILSKPRSVSMQRKAISGSSSRVDLKLHLIMIEERKARLRSDIDDTDPHSLNRYIDTAAYDEN